MLSFFCDASDGRSLQLSNRVLVPIFCKGISPDNGKLDYFSETFADIADIFCRDATGAEEYVQA